ncbi:hypothetical protein I317_07114 [Kwoniella heveanensis CBS 569]|uniref:Major facilitator superfamily (MFS) profile domain-containing protein n=1 Tax=Kwoniella heveanensis BCC8398 TaxID=1296120 RepID=A0A1B9GMF4_9TREE|nr:hypothetical protein I316_06075 [Kwoniella heveanensis BCC8398]OCF39090.1 hypothetical protein I317_07114 [Kwoniella heveanensis CBS 569]
MTTYNPHHHSLEWAAHAPPTSLMRSPSATIAAGCPTISGLATVLPDTEIEGHKEKEKAHSPNGNNEADEYAGSPGLSQRKKWSLLGLFCLGVFLDVLGVCSFYILLTPVAETLDIVFQQQTWIVTSFGVTFASFLLFWGRFADLYSPKPVFCYAFLSFGILNLVISFLTNKYAYLVIRGLTGVTAAALIPASYRLITSIFEEDELPRAFTVYSLSGSAAGALGVVFGGVMTLIPGGGQMAGWRWFFRITASIVIPLSLWSFRSIPGRHGKAQRAKGLWKRLDIFGTFLILFAILLFILSLTMGASYGWSTAGFIAPLVLSVMLFPSFFFWESYVHPSNALIPPVTWKAPNFIMWILLATFGYAWWTCNQIPIIEVWTEIYGDKPIISALRLLPSGGFSIMSSLILIAFPKWTVRPRIGFTIGQIGGMVAYGLFIASKGHTGKDYYRFYLPGLAIGSFLNNVSVTIVMVGAMTSAPAEQAGVVGALLQAAIQGGNVIGLTVQAGLLTIRPGGTSDYSNVTASFYFMIGWGGACLLAFWVFYRNTGEARNGVVPVH